MADIYDVIIIGTGAGGGTLAAELAPFGKRILLLERGGWLPREKQNWNVEDVFVENRYVSKDTWYDKDGKPFQPGVHYYVGGATKMYGAALYRLRERDFGELRHQDGISPAWPISYADLEPYYTRAENLYQVHGARGEDPTEPPASAPYPHPAVSHEPRIQQLHDDLARAGYRPFHTPCGIMLTENNMPFSKCIRCMDCDGFPCLVHAKSDAEVIAVRPALTVPQRHAAHQRARDAAQDQPDRHRGDRGGRRARRGASRATGARSSWSPAAPPTRPACCSPPPTTSTRAASPTARTRWGATTCATTTRPSWRSRRSRTRPAIRRRWASTTSTSSGPGSDYPLGNIQMVGKSQAPMFRGEKHIAKLAPLWSLEMLAKHARRLLALHRGPAAAREPGHAGERRQHPSQLHQDQPGPDQEALRAAQVDAGAPGDAPGSPGPAQPLPEERDGRSPRSRIRPAPAGSAPIPRRRCSTSTARRTSSTTSTSSTPASSRASAR